MEKRDILADVVSKMNEMSISSPSVERDTKIFMPAKIDKENATTTDNNKDNENTHESLFTKKSTPSKSTKIEIKVNKSDNFAETVFATPDRNIENKSIESVENSLEFFQTPQGINEQSFNTKPRASFNLINFDTPEVRTQSSVRQFDKSASKKTATLTRDLLSQTLNYSPGNDAEFEETQENTQELEDFLHGSQDFDKTLLNTTEKTEELVTVTVTRSSESPTSPKTEESPAAEVYVSEAITEQFSSKSGYYIVENASENTEINQTFEVATVEEKNLESPINSSENVLKENQSKTTEHLKVSDETDSISEESNTFSGEYNTVSEESNKSASDDFKTFSDEIVTNSGEIVTNSDEPSNSSGSSLKDELCATKNKVPEEPKLIPEFETPSESPINDLITEEPTKILEQFETPSVSPIDQVGSETLKKHESEALNKEESETLQEETIEEEPELLKIEESKTSTKEESEIPKRETVKEEKLETFEKEKAATLKEGASEILTDGEDLKAGESKTLKKAEEETLNKEESETLDEQESESSNFEEPIQTPISDFKSPSKQLDSDVLEEETASEISTKSLEEQQISEKLVIEKPSSPPSVEELSSHTVRKESFEEKNSIQQIASGSPVSQIACGSPVGQIAAETRLQQKAEKLTPAEEKSPKTAGSPLPLNKTTCAKNLDTSINDLSKQLASQNIKEGIEKYYDSLEKLPDDSVKPEKDLVNPNYSNVEDNIEKIKKIKMLELQENEKLLQELSDIKLELNACKQARACLELELSKKDEVVLKTQAEYLKKEQSFQQEIKNLKEQVVNAKANIAEKESSKDLEAALKELKAELNAKINEEKNNKRIMEEYEKSLSTKVAGVQKLKEENETVNRHLANLELSFSDVHQKYERCKNAILGFKKNEDILRQKLSARDDTIEKMEERYESLKAHATAQIEKSNKTITQMKESNDSEIAKCKAIIRRLEIKNASLENALEQKTKECADLAALCDEVTGKKF